MRDGATSEIERVATVLKALGSVSRLSLVWALRDPLRAREACEAAGLSMSDTGVRKHLEDLVSAGLLRASANGRETTYRLEPRTLFVAIDHLRAVGSIVAQVDATGDGTPTMEARSLTPLPPGPQLVLVRGLPEGRVTRLADDGTWTIGRSAEASVPLAHDPFVSKEHATVTARNGRIEVRPLALGKNGTTLNGRMLASERSRRLTAGDILGVGRSLLLFREGEVAGEG